ncbi:hypothetical protein ACN6MY_03835 [Peribacillus sp. B-H-3]|uniref:hypothetical protein n=1 Tax=Peribacillus sp. B-H-3 TaxID=3400420 RepID=UPI003B018959
MQNSIDQVAKLLMYKGPKISDLISIALNEGKQFSINKDDYSYCLTTEFKTAYDITVVDNYIFNLKDELIKQTLNINNKEKVVFDKYTEAKQLLKNITKSNVLVS